MTEIITNKEINCPYYWNCGQTFKSKELNEYDFNFLQSATIKKMTFMLIHCPKCSQMFKFDTVKREAMAMSSNPNLKVEKMKKTVKQLTAILNKSKIEIPTPYFEYLISDNFNSEILIFEDEYSFELYDLEELCEKIKVDGKPYHAIRKLKGFANTLLEVIGEQEGQPFSLKELSNCLAIGYENTRILFIDNRDNNSLWIFHPDGGDCEKTTMTLDKIIKREK